MMEPPNNFQDLHSLSETGLIPYPDPTKLLSHQKEVLFQNPQRFKVLIWHRRARKTTTAIYQMVVQAQRRVGVYWHIFPTYGEAKDAVWRDPHMLFDIIPNSLIARKNETELVIYFKNGSVYQLKGSDDPEALRGPNPVGVIFDEFDTQKADAWGVVEPIIRANGGWVWFIGTPRGKQKLFEFYHRGQTGHSEWCSWLLKASQSGIVPADQLVESKKSMTDSLYRQEWECEFIEAAGSVFRGVEEIMVATPKPPEKEHLYLMGVDLAKVQDFTVIRVYDRDTNSLVYSDRFQTLEWPFQKMKIAAVARHYNKALTILDATGIGDPIADDLIRAGVSVIPFKITEVSKKDIIEKLSIWIEQKKIKLIKNKETLFEYENFSYDIGPTGKIRYNARSGLHDDIVLADALAVWHLNPVYMPEFSREPTPTQVAFARARMSYEQGQHNSEDGGGEDFGHDMEWYAEGAEEGGYGI
jgi:hypothetical protein